MRKLSLKAVTYHLSKYIPYFNKFLNYEDKLNLGLNSLELPDGIGKSGTSSSQKLDIKSFNTLMAVLYQNRSGYICEINREDPDLARKDIFLTYGEILPEGLGRLLDFIKPTEQDVLVDLGAGAGKVVLQSHLCTNIKKSIGIEVDGARYKLANEIAGIARAKLPDYFKNKDIEFLNKNLVNYDYHGATILFANSICFGGNLLADIIAKVNASKTIRAVMTTKKITEFANLPNMSEIQIETSWHVPPHKSTCYIYYKSGPFDEKLFTL